MARDPIVRAFAGKVPGSFCTNPDFASLGYQKGVPMGGELGPVSGNGSPSFAVLAMKDAGTADAPGTPLQRIQMVKGWIDDSGQAQEQVFDITKKPNNGATVDTATCETSGPGSDSLCAVWKDPKFKANQRAFYYARVVENPTCRWSNYICNAAGVDCSNPAAVPADYATCCDATVPKTIQERAWTSPFWYEPDGIGKVGASVAFGKVSGADVLKVTAQIGAAAPAFNPDADPLTLTLRDDDTIYAVTIPAGTMTNKGGGKYELKDKAGTLGGLKSVSLKVPPNRPAAAGRADHPDGSVARRPRQPHGRDRSEHRQLPRAARPAVGAQGHQAANELRMGRRVRAWLTRPGLHFVVIGLTLFAIDRARQPAPTLAPPTGRVAELRAEFIRQTGVPPQPAEEAELAAQALDEELLYREALARGLDQGPAVRHRLAEKVRFFDENEQRDPEALYREALALGLDQEDAFVRRSLIERMRLIAQREIPAGPASDATLQAYLERHADDYRQPPRVRFSQVFLSRDRHGDGVAQAAASVLATLQSPTPPALDTLGDAFPTGPTANLMTQRELEKFFGSGFASRVMHLDPGVWSGPLPSAYGLHVVRVEAREPERLPSLAAVRNQVEHAYRLEQGEAAYAALLQRLRAKYGTAVAREPVRLLSTGRVLCPRSTGGAG